MLDFKIVLLMEDLSREEAITFRYQALAFIDAAAFVPGERICFTLGWLLLDEGKMMKKAQKGFPKAEVNIWVGNLFVSKCQSCGHLSFIVFHFEDKLSKLN